MVTLNDVKVAVPGGWLHAGRWGRDGSPAVLLIHGITASFMCWPPLAEALPEFLVLAPDLRGRGASAQLPGPFGMVRHADDLVALLDAARVGQAVVVGHSMGGFVAAVLAHRHPERVRRLVLVDGGPPLPLPEGVDPEVILNAVIGPAMTRLATVFPSRQAYREFWQAHPAFAGRWSPSIEAYVDYDLVGQEPHLRSRVSADAVRGDNTDLVTGTALTEAMAQLARPAVFLAAGRGMQDEPAPLYPQPVVEAWTARSPQLTCRRIDDLNHYTIVFDPRGVAEIAAEVRAAWN